MRSWGATNVMVPVAAYSGLRAADGSSVTNPMLSLGQSSYQTALCRSQHVAETELVSSRLHPFYTSAESGFRLNPWLSSLKESLPSGERSSSSKIPVPSALILKTSVSDVQEKDKHATSQEENLEGNAPSVHIEKTKPSLFKPKGLESETYSEVQPHVQSSSSQSSTNTKFSCGLLMTQMNGIEKLAMTGSSNPRTEHLNWLADVATGGSRAAQNKSSSPNHEKVTAAGPPTAHSPETLASSLLLSNSGSFFRPPLTMASPGDLSSQRIYNPPYHSGHHSHHTSSSLSGTNLSLYYSQASRMPPYSSFYHGQYPPSASYSSVVTPSATTATNQSLVTRPYFQVESYSSALASIGTNMQPVSSHTHSQLPHSPGYLQQTILTSSPLGHSAASSPNPCTPPQQRNIMTSRSPEEQINISRSPHEREKNHPVMQQSPTASHLGQDERRKSYMSPVQELTPPTTVPGKGSDTVQRCGHSDYKIIKDFTHHVSQIAYRVPTGKEGSLKHRILRPPSINIVDPPPSVILDAPLSAPPIRTHGEEPSSKQLKLEASSGYRSYSTSTSGADISQTSMYSQPLVARLSPLFSANHGSTLTTCSTSPLPPVPPGSGPQLQYPAYFMKGSIIQLANGQLKQVEHLTTEDFIESASLSSDLRIDSSTVINIEKIPASGSAKLGFSVGQNQVQITVEAPLEHPFFVFNQGWSSCSPERSLHRYGLSCNKLKVGDICISLTQKEPPCMSEQPIPTTEISSLTTPFKQSFSVPTNATSELCGQVVKSAVAGNSLQIGRPKGRNDMSRSVSIQPLSIPVEYNCMSEKPIAQADQQQRHHHPSLTSVPSSLEIITTLFQNNVPPRYTTSKRKRRWSAPDHFSLHVDPPSSLS